MTAPRFKAGKQQKQATLKGEARIILLHSSISIQITRIHTRLPTRSATAFLGNELQTGCVCVCVCLTQGAAANLPATGDQEPPGGARRTYRGDDPDTTRLRNGLTPWRPYAAGGGFPARGRCLLSLPPSLPRLRA